jgi:thymidylate synthase
MEREEMAMFNDYAKLPLGIVCESATSAFQFAYKLLEDFGEIVESRIGKAKHLTDITFCVEDPYKNVCVDKHRKLSLKYLIGEISWYMSGSNKVADIAKYAKMWNYLTDDGETVNSAYGYRIFHRFGFDQLQYAIEKLKKNPYDRQAVIHIKEASNAPTKDMPCTCLIQFTCQNGRLNAHTYMRSNDIWLGLPYDMAFFCVLLQIVSKETGLETGMYYHTVGDLHLYEKHWGKHVVVTEEEEFGGWDYTLETEESLNRILEGEKPIAPLLKRLWEVNREKSN